VLQDILTEARALGADKPSCSQGASTGRPTTRWVCRRRRGARGCACSTGGGARAGREELRKRIDILAHARPALLVSTAARWTLNGFAGGYAKSVVKGGVVREMADEGVYKVLLEGLEGFVAAIAGAQTRDGDDAPNYAIDAQGRRYLSARATHRQGHG
jgi:hypothetical protein